MSTNIKTPDYSEMGRKSAQSRRVAAIERRVRELVGASPPLTAEQRDRLAVLLRPSAAA